MKILFHVDEMSRWTTCVANVQNTLNYFAEHGVDGKLEVIANAEAVRGLSAGTSNDAEVLQALEGFLAQGVRIAACRNAMNKQHLTEDDLLSEVVVVPAGIIALAERQQEGYAYIRP